MCWGKISPGRSLFLGLSSASVFTYFGCVWKLLCVVFICEILNLSSVLRPLTLSSGPVFFSLLTSAHLKSHSQALFQLSAVLLSPSYAFTCVFCLVFFFCGYTKVPFSPPMVLCNVPFKNDVLDLTPNRLDCVSLILQWG